MQMQTRNDLNGNLWLYVKKTWETPASWSYRERLALQNLIENTI